MTEYVSALGIDFDSAGLNKAVTLLERLGTAGDRIDRSFSTGSKAFTSAENAVRDLGGASQSAASATENLAGAEDRAASSAQKLAGSAKASAQAVKELAANSNMAGTAFNAASSTKAVAGLTATGKAAKLTASELLNVSYQFQDLGVQLASGQNPITAMIQQGSQLSNVFAIAGQRGIGFTGVIRGILGAAGGLLAALTPVIAAVAALGAGFALFNREVTKNTAKDLTDGLGLTAIQLERIKESGESTAVTLGDTFKATFQVIGRYAAEAGENILEAFGTSGDEIAKKFNSILDQTTSFIGQYYATIYGLFKGLAAASGAIWGNLPKVIGDAFVTALNFAYKTVVDFLNKITPLINQATDILKLVNPLANLIPKLNQITFTPIRNQFAGAAGNVVTAFTEGLNSGRSEALAAMDKFISDIAKQAEKNGQDRLKKAAGKAGKDAADAMGRSLDEALRKFDDWLLKMDQAWERAASITRDGAGKVSKVFTDLTAKINASGPSLAFKKGLVGSGADITQTLQFMKDLGAATQAASEANGNLNAHQIETIENLSRAKVEAERFEAVLNRAAQRQYDLSKEGRAQRTSETLTDAFDRFIEDIPRKGFAAFKTLIEDMGALFQSVWADAMKKALDPFVTKLKEKLSAAFDKLFDKIGSAIKTALDKISPKLSAQLGNVSAKAIEGVAGYQAGQAASSALGGNKSKEQNQNSQIGVALGAVIGSLIPGIGTLLGSFIGTTLGGLFGPGSTNAAASSLLDASGRSTSGLLGTKRTSETEGAVNEFIKVLQSGYSSLKELGGTLTTYVKNIEIGQRDPSKIDLSNGQQVRSAVGDTGAAQNAALIEVLRGTTFATEGLNRLKDSMIAAGASFDDTYSALNKVDALLKSTQPALSDWAKALAEFQKTLSGEALDVAKSALAGAFNKSVADELEKLTAPLSASLKALVETQTARMKDAVSLGADISAVTKLNQAEFKSFLSSIDLTGAEFTSLADILAKLQATARAAGQDVTALTNAFNGAVKAIVDTFNEDISDKLLNLSNPTLASLESLLETQKARMASAKALGANLVAVDRLNSLEIKKFFEGLTADQKLALGDYLGIIEDYTGKIAVVLSKLSDTLTARIDNLDETRNTLLETASTLRGLAETIKATRESIQDQYGAATPLARIASLRSQFAETSASAIAGDQAAAGKLPDLANKLIELSRSLYGSTDTFVADFNSVTTALKRAEDAAIAQASSAESQAQTLLEQRDLLVQIRDTLQGSDANFDFLGASLDKLATDNGDIKALLAQYLNLNTLQNNASLTDAQLQNVAMLSASQYVGSAPSTQPATSTGVITAGAAQSASASPSGQTSTDTLLAYNADITEAGLAEVVELLKRNNSDLRALSEYLKQNVA